MFLLGFHRGAGGPSDAFAMVASRWRRQFLRKDALWLISVAWRATPGPARRFFPLKRPPQIVLVLVVRYLPLETTALGCPGTSASF